MWILDLADEFVAFFFRINIFKGRGTRETFKNYEWPGKGKWTDFSLSLIVL